MSFDEFMDNANTKINDFFKTRKPIHEENINKIKENYLNVVSGAYDDSLDSSIAEVRVGPYEDADTKIKLGGKVDRIDNHDNTYSIVDYKTGRKLKHNEDDVTTCFQVLLYAYILEQQEKKNMTSCKYLYLRLNRVVNCVYNEDIKKQLKSILNNLKETLDSGEFITQESKDTCKYCTFSKVCGRDESLLEKRKWLIQD